MIDRREALKGQTKVTGIDFVRVTVSQTKLIVYFLEPKPSALTPKALFGDLQQSQVKIVLDPAPGMPELPAYIDLLPEQGRLTTVPISNMLWRTVGANAREVLVLTTSQPGGFSLYRLHIEDDRLDPYFNDIQFSFKANCESPLDCAPPEAECPIDSVVDVPVDYLTRDFESMRGALLDFAAARYPAWQDRTEADTGMMFVELLSALGDEMAYNQDRAGREAFLETASQRRSIRKHARLLDYDPDDGRAATTWIDVTVHPGLQGTIPAGTPVVDVAPDTSQGIMPASWFEVGHGLDEAMSGVQYAVDSVRNEFMPHIWDATKLCLPIGSTELCIEGHHTADLPFDDGLATASPGKWMLLQTSPTDPSIAPRVWKVRVIQINDEVDPLQPLPGSPITRLRWEDAQATPFEMDLALSFRVRGNLVPATAGKTNTASFTVGPSTDPAVPSAIQRIGHDDTAVYLFSLPGSDTAQLSVLSYPLGNADRGAAFRKPEVALQATPLMDVWTFQKSFFGFDSVFALDSALPDDRVFTIEDGTWRRVAGYRRKGNDIVFADYAGASGATIRFGDGEFGEIPGEPTKFLATYRLGQGATDNIAANVLTQTVPATFGGLIDSLTNPLPALDGIDPETNEQVRRLAPFAYQDLTFRAVRPEDYAEAAMRLSWVQQAGATIRWTGSWPTIFVTPDPRGSFSVDPEEALELEQQMDRFRQTGREVYERSPIYADLDLKIWLCVTAAALSVDGSNATRVDVGPEVLKVLFGTTGVRPRPGFFAHDNFTFGTPLERSALEGAIAAVPGVKAVESISIRRRGWHDWRDFHEFEYKVGANEMIRVGNSRLLPDRGSVQLFVELSR